MEKHELEALTVLQLRKVAKENKVKLGAGIDKAGIVDKILSAQAAPAPIPEEPKKRKPRVKKAVVEEPKVEEPQAEETQAEEPQGEEAQVEEPQAEEAPSIPQEDKPLFQATFDVTAAPAHGYSKPTFGPQDNFRSGYNNWQNRNQSSPRPLRPATQNRFGPQARVAAEPQAETVPEEPVRKEPVVTSDGYRLGYQAKPQRTNYRQDYNRNTGSSSASQRSSYPQRNQPYQEAEHHFHDDVYRMPRNPDFDRDTGSEPPASIRLSPQKAVSGLLELNPDGYGFLRSRDFTFGVNDAYVSVAQIRRFGLRPGDLVEGFASRVREADKYPALMTVKEVNGSPAQENPTRCELEKLTAIFPNRRIHMDADANTTLRLADLVAPMGFGQRMLVRAQPDSGSLNLLRDMANSIKKNHPETEVLMLLVDATPEEINEVKESTQATVLAADFSSQPEIQSRSCETILERGMRLAENGKDAVILLDSLTKMVKAYQNSMSQGSRALNGALTPAALVRPKRFFGMARNLREGGSLTIVATVLTGTGSRVDDLIYEEFKSAANSELLLTTYDLTCPLFPMLDLQQSATRRGDMLLTVPEKNCIQSLKTMLSEIPNNEAVSQLAEMVEKTANNTELLKRLKEWIALMEKA